MNLEEFTGEKRGSEAYFAKLEQRIRRFHSNFVYVELMPAMDGRPALSTFGRMKDPAGAKEFMEILRYLDIKNPQERNLINTALGGVAVMELLKLSGQLSELLDFIILLDRASILETNIANAFVLDNVWYHSKVTRQPEAFRSILGRTSPDVREWFGRNGPDHPKQKPAVADKPVPR